MLALLEENFPCHLPGIVVRYDTYCVISTLQMYYACTMHSLPKTVPDHPNKSNTLEVAETSCRTDLDKGHGCEDCEQA